MASVREHARPDNQRVTAGIPSLTSERRMAITDAYLKRAYQTSLVSEYQANDDAANQPRDAARPMNNWDAQVGIPLRSHQIIKRLRKLNPSLWFELSRADHNKTGIYIPNPVDGSLQYIVGMETEVNPEFTVTINDDNGNFQRMIPGWRRVLMRLIRAGFISESGANALFGPPNRDSERWATFTQ